MKHVMFTALTFDFGVAGYFTYLLVDAKLRGYDHTTVYFNWYHEHIPEAILLSAIVVVSVAALIYLFNQWFPRKRKGE